MKKNLAKLFVFTALLITSACHFNVKIEQEAEAIITQNTAVAFVNAYNEHDSDKMLSMVHDEVKYMYVDGANIFTETNNKNELAQFLVKFFEQKPNAHSEVVSSHKSNHFIHQVEKALWLDQAGKQTAQCSLSVYEMKNDLILNVWYYQAYQCALSDN